MKKILTLIMMLALVVGCSSPTPENNASDLPLKVFDKNPEATIKLEGYNPMTFELFINDAPQSVYNFISLADAKFYDGLLIHRLIPGFVAQGGDPEGNGTGGPGYSIKGEFLANGIDNSHEHITGTLSMARSRDYDSAGSQFFIVLAPAPHLDKEYAAFGQITKGQEVLDQLNTVATDGNDKPVKDLHIESITINKFDQEIPQPNKLN